MLSRRLFANCALCAAIGLLASKADAQTTPSGYTRTIANRIDYPGDTMATIQVIVEIEPHAVVPLHTHPGVESGAVIEGESTFSMKGQPDRVVRAGDTFQVPPGVPHKVVNGAARSRIVSVYVVEKDKPLVTLVPE